jgi:surface antigen/peptidoglycan hydrolase CwlO-like protein
MPKQKLVKTTIFKLRTLALLLAAVGVVGGATLVHADSFDQQIQALNDQNNNSKSLVNGLVSEASNYQDAINQLQQQINVLQAALSSNQTKQADLQQQISDNEAKIAQEKQYLGDDIKAMYVEGQMSSIEQLATSKNLSDYVDKEEYRTSVQDKIDSMIKDIADLQAKLQQQKQELDVVVNSEKQQNDQLSAAQSQQQQMLSYNESQQSAYNSQIAGNNSKIAQLRQQQLLANARFTGGAAGTGYACGGGYPARWCEIAQDSVIDSWGMYNRECVSYTAFRVAASGRYMPYWGGAGNANQWPGDARAAGIPVDGNPQAGDVAISMNGYYGHAMYVESVNGDGSINISQYNASLNGLYSTRSGVSPAGLYFIHFP